MKLLVAADAHIFRMKDNSFWCKSIYGYSFWQRYLDVFDCVRVVARVKDVTEVPKNYLRVDGPRIEIFGIPFFQGPKQLISMYPKIRKTLKKVYMGCDVGIFRMPSQTAQMVYMSCKGHLSVIGGEIVFDPIDSLYNNESIKYKIANRIRIRYLKDFCLSANGLSYVTADSIQKHFPGRARLYGESNSYFEINYSTITLNDDAYHPPREYNKQDSIKVVLSDVSMNNDGKGEIVLLDSILMAREKGYNVEGTFIGDGSERESFQKYARKIGLVDCVHFTGMLSTPAEVRSVLLDSDIYILPTIAEGLPRGILEAMAVGLPVLSTPVGGIPEVIDEEYLFAPKDSVAFSNMICYLCDHPEEMTKMSNNNHTKAMQFKNTILQRKRNEFYGRLKTLAESNKEV